MTSTPIAGELIRVLLVEDHLVLAQSLASLLARDPSIEVVEISTTRRDAEQAAGRTKPDLILMDLRLPDGSGAQAAAGIRGRNARPIVVFLTGDDTDEALAEAIEAGGAAFVSKAASPDVVIDAIKRTYRGETLIRPDQVRRALAERGARRERDRERESVLGRLTPRELEILQWLGAGLTVAEIAAGLHISLLTVRTHVKSLLAKLDAHTQLEAVARAQTLGIVNPLGTA